MTQDEAEKLARKLQPRKGAPDNQWCPRRAGQLHALCDHILSGDMRREIENAAYERAANLADDYCGTECEGTGRQIRSLIQPPAQKENGK